MVTDSNSPDEPLIPVFEARPKRLFVMGAGASHGYELPLMGEMADQLRAEMSEDQRSAFDETVFEVCDTDLAQGTAGFDLEDFLVRVNALSLLRLTEEELTDLEYGRHRAAAAVLSNLRPLIVERAARASGQSGLYDRLVACLGEGDVLLSFNWDVLLEHALERASRLYDYIGDRIPKETTLVLKPHGSMNWRALFQEEMVQVKLDQVRALRSGYFYYIVYPLTALGELDESGLGHLTRKTVYRQPAIALPAGEKVLAVGGPSYGDAAAGHRLIIRDTWSSLNTALESVEKVVVLGYSLPGLDRSAIDSFRSFSRREERRRDQLVIVDQSERIANRWKRVLSAECKFLKRDLAQFDPREL